MHRLSAYVLVIACAIIASPRRLTAQHDHPAPEKLGSVSFATTCSATVQNRFNRAVALLHSFAYGDAEKAFDEVLAADPACAMARWGIAMSYFHQLWEPPLNRASYEKGAMALGEKTNSPTVPDREQGYLEAIRLVYSSEDSKPMRERMLAYQDKMAEVAKTNPDDTEAQVFYALALLSTAPASDKTHANQKKAMAILEPLYAANPQHPGIAHYMIHACDNAEMAQQGLQAAREYSKIAPSAPHALHMPSHIFTRLGMWNESVASNEAARRAAHEQGDIGEELHAMDYLTYAYLQLGRNSEAAAVVAELQQMSGLQEHNFKVGYAATAMPVRLAVEREDWESASRIQPAANAPGEVTAVAVWAKATGMARLGRTQEAKAEAGKLQALEQELRKQGKSYWAEQAAIQSAEAEAWISLAKRDGEAAEKLMRSAAEREESIEKLPLTPGPIVPAREQLGYLLLELNEPERALPEFEASLEQSPWRRNALLGAEKSAMQSKNHVKREQYAAALEKLPSR